MIGRWPIESQSSSLFYTRMLDVTPSIVETYRDRILWFRPLMEDCCLRADLGAAVNPCLHTPPPDVASCEGFRMPAAHERCRALWRPASENLQGRKPLFGARYGDLIAADDAPERRQDDPTHWPMALQVMRKRLPA
jgi:hypothetical protein